MFSKMIFLTTGGYLCFVEECQSKEKSQENHDGKFTGIYHKWRLFLGLNQKYRMKRSAS